MPTGGALVLRRCAVAGSAKSPAMKAAIGPMRGADAQRYQSIYDTDTIIVDRVGTGITRVERPAVSIVGTTQPEELRRILGREHISNGLCPRFLVAMPECGPRRWTDAEADPEACAAVGRVFEGLLAVPMRFDNHGRPAR